MNIRSFTTTVADTFLIVSAHALTQKIDKTEKIKSTTQVSGKLVAFELGDYVDAVVKGANFGENSYYVEATTSSTFLPPTPERPYVGTSDD